MAQKFRMYVRPYGRQQNGDYAKWEVLLVNGKPLDYNSERDALNDVVPLMHDGILTDELDFSVLPISNPQTSTMAYNNQNRNYNNRGGYNNRYGGGGGNYNNYNRGGNYNNGGNDRQKKKSGCTSGLTRTNKPYVRGWKYDRTHGLRAFIAGPNAKSHVSQSQSGRDWVNWTAKVTGPNGVELYNALFDVANNKVIIKDLGIVMNPKTNYVGPYFRRKNK